MRFLLMRASCYERRRIYTVNKVRSLPEAIPYTWLSEDSRIDRHGAFGVEVAEGLSGGVTIVDEHPISKIKVLALYGEVIHWHGVGR